MFSLYFTCLPGYSREEISSSSARSSSEGEAGLAELKYAANCRRREGVSLRVSSWAVVGSLAKMVAISWR